MSDSQPDKVTALLAEVRERGWRNGAGGITAARLSDCAAEDVPRLLAAVEAALATHAAERGAGRMICAECVDRWADGEHKDWPCGTVQAISRALLGEGESDAS